MRFAEVVFASPNHGKASSRGTKGTAGSEYWVPDDVATHVSSDGGNVYHWVEPPPEKQKCNESD